MNNKTKHLIKAAKVKKSCELTRRERVLLMLAGGGWVSGLKLTLEGGGLGCRARISDLRKMGVSIEWRVSPSCPKGESWTEYRLKPEEAAV